MAKSEVKWTKLESASKIFPAIVNEKDTKVFRLSCDLTEFVNPMILQEALNITVKEFPIYSSVLKRGFFWYFFEEKASTFDVYPDTQPLHSALYIDSKSPLFRVVYHKRRISLEVFHALTDGMGASWFPRTLVAHYLNIKHEGQFADELADLDLSASVDEKMADSFAENYRKKHIKKPLPSPYANAYVIKGSRNSEYRTKVIEATMSVQATLALAKAHGTSLTIYLTALLIHAIRAEMAEDELDKPIVIAVPINLRNHFDSKTSRNFFANMEINYVFEEGDETLADTITHLNLAFRDNLSGDNLTALLDKYMDLESNTFMRAVPLVLKDAVLRIAGRINYNSLSSLISNLGQIQLPEAMKPYVEKFSFSASSSTPQISLCSFRDNLVISFNSPFADTEIQRNFYRYLTDAGIEMTVTANM